MSRSNPNEDARLVNPAVRFFEWSGSQESGGAITYYDKENKKQVQVDLPFSFMPLRRAITVKGYNGDTETTYWSNEVKNPKTDKLIVMSATGKGEARKKRVEMIGLYSDIKDSLKAKGIKYTESLYVAYKEGKDLKLCNFQIKGAALKPWLDFVKENKIWEIAASIKSSVQGKKGGVKYFSPVFTPVKVSEEANAKAIELDKEIELFLELYYAQNAERANSETVEAKAETKADTKSEAKPAAKAETKPSSRSAQVEEEEEEEDIHFSTGDDDEEPEF